MKTHALKILAAASLIAGTAAFAGQPEAGSPMHAKGERHAKMIERFDADGDGKLSDAERAAAKQALSAENPDRAAKHAERIKRFDKDGDGQLSDAERAAAKKEMKGRGEKGRERAVKRFDKDGDGALNEAERSHAREIARAHNRGRMHERLVTRFDKDGDGRLTDEERAEARKARAEFRERRPLI
jgi:Ca2+-binding EF-hand superfamily protein